MPRKRELHDPYFLRAKEEGYVARSAYKLLQIHERRPIMYRADKVIDLGCAPGSWLQVASEVVGPEGRVLGIDLTPVRLELPNVRTLVADAFTVNPDELIEILGDQASVLLSDMAPNTTGAPQGDHFRSVNLCRRVLEIAPKLLCVGGTLVMKVFEGELYPELLAQMRKEFMDGRGYKPDATRDVSREMFLLGVGYKGGPLAAPPAPASVPGGDPRSPYAHRVPPHKRLPDQVYEPLPKRRSRKPGPATGPVRPKRAKPTRGPSPKPKGGRRSGGKPRDKRA